MTAWKSVRLEEVAVINPSRPKFPPEFRDETPVTFVPMPAVNEFTGSIDEPEIRPFGSVKKGFTYFGEGDVIFAKITPCMQNGKSAIARNLSNGIGFGSTEFHVVRPDCQEILPEWVWYFLRQDWFRREAIHHFRGAVGQQRVPREFLEESQIPLPPIAEQHRIIARLKSCIDRLDEIETLRSDQSDLPGNVLRAARRELLGDPKRIPDGWRERRLDELADVIYGISAAIAGNRDASVGPPIVRMANISKSGQLDLSDLRYCPIPKGKEEHFALRRGDLLLNWRSGSSDHVGKTAIFDAGGLFTCASFILRIRTREGASNNRYLRHVLNFLRAEGVFSGSSRMQINHKLNAAEFSAFPIRVPPTLDDQDRIADQLDAAESIALNLDVEAGRQAEETAQLRSAVLRRAFAGEL
jgi:type I restriction enzyme S subunit